MTLPFAVVSIDDLVSSPLNPAATSTRRGSRSSPTPAMAAASCSFTIVVRQCSTPADPAVGPIYEIVAGERRWRAARLAGLADVPVIIKDLDDKQVLEIMVIENNARQDDAPRGKDGFKRLKAVFGFNIDELAARIGHFPAATSTTACSCCSWFSPRSSSSPRDRSRSGTRSSWPSSTPEQQAVVIKIDRQQRQLHRVAVHARGLPVHGRRTAEAEGALRRRQGEVRARVGGLGRQDSPVRPDGRGHGHALPGLPPRACAAGKVVSISYSHWANGENKDILLYGQWKRADGGEVEEVLEQHDGRSRSALPARRTEVCTAKGTCQVHWADEIRAAVGRRRRRRHRLRSPPAGRPTPRRPRTPARARRPPGGVATSSVRCRS